MWGGVKVYKHKSPTICMAFDRKEYNRRYRQEHKEERNEEKNKKVVCECGTTFTTKMKARHIRSKFHQDFTQKTVELRAE